MENPFGVIAAERNAFADVLEGLTPHQWATPSLCGAWTVKDVVAHVMVGPTASIPEVLAALVRGGLVFDRANERLVANRSGKSTDELIAVLRAKADSRFTPPGMDWHAPLSDLFVHRLDCLVPLGIATDRPVEAWTEILPFLLSPKAKRAFLGTEAPALTYRATDLDRSWGDGPEVVGPAEAIGAALCGRAAVLDRLSGPGLEALRRHAEA